MATTTFAASKDRILQWLVGLVMTMVGIVGLQIFKKLDNLEVQVKELNAKIDDLTQYKPFLQKLQQDYFNKPTAVLNYNFRYFKKEEEVLMPEPHKA